VGRASSLAVVAISAAAAGSLVAGARVPARGPTRADLDSIAAEIDARMREVAASARSRAQTLADLPRLALAVATDAPTVRDLTQDELAFRPGPNETIEIAQVLRSGASPVSLLRIPSDSQTAVPLASPGVHLVRDGASLRAAAVARIEPRERSDELFGVVAVSLPLALPSPPALLAALGGGLRLETPAGPVPIGGPLAEDAGTTSVDLTSELGRGARLVGPGRASGGWSAGLLALASGIAALGLVVAGLLWRRGPRDRYPAPPSEPTRRRGPTQPPPTERLDPGPDVPESFRLGRYSAIRLLGSGGMADVWLARAEGEAGFERLVALKVVQDAMVSNPKFVSHFLDEARLASQLVHPNIIAITDLGRADDKYYIAMEYIDGADLERLIHSVVRRQARVPPGVALAIVRHICDGLHFAHTAVDRHGEPLRLVHRDVKSANVFVARTGAVKVGDFGIAKAAGPDRAVRTEIGEIKGTAAYMSPEQRIGHEVDRRADIYGVGAICYELLTGRVINLDFAMLAHLGREGWPHLPAPSTVRPELPPELDSIVFCAMAFDPEARFSTCEALDMALAAVVERHGLGASDKVIARWIAEELALLPERPAPSAGTRTWAANRRPAGA